MDDSEIIDGYARKIDDFWVMWPYDNWKLVKKPYLPHYLEFMNEEQRATLERCNYKAKSIPLSIKGAVLADGKMGMDATIIVASITSISGGKYCSL